MKHFRLALTALLVLLMFAFAACGGDDDDAPDDSGDEPTAAESADGSDDGDDDAEPTEEGDDGDDDDADEIDACTLLTVEEVSAVMGVQMGEPRVTNATYEGFTSCDWDVTDETAVAFVHVEVSTDDPGDHQGTYDSWAEFQDTEEIPGLGDQAQWDLVTNQLDILDGDNYLIVQGVGALGVEIDSKSAALALAPLALERLP